MKILLFSQFYPPERIAAAFRAAENAQTWQDMGAQVTVFTGYPNYPEGQIFPGYEAKLLSKQQVDGVTVLRSKLVATRNISFVKRLVNAFSFLICGLWNLLVNARTIGNDYDVVLGTSGPVFAALLGWVYALFHRKPFVFEIRDITYRQMIATGSDPRGISVRMMRALELFLCRRARRVVVVTHGFKAVLTQEGIAADKIEVITNGVDVPEREGTRPAPDAPFTLSYFGTLGISQNVEATLPYAAELARHIERFDYLIVGDGAVKEALSATCAQPQYGFVRMLPAMDQHLLEPYYDQTQLSIVTLQKSSDFQYTIPSKLFQIMGRGKAVLFIGPEGETAEIIRKYDAGLTLTGDEAQDIATLRGFFGAPDWRARLSAMMENGRRAAVSEFSRTELAKRYLELLQAVAGK